MTSIVSIETGAGAIMVDTDRLNAAIRDHAFKLGLSNMLRDAHASETLKDGGTRATKFALAEKKLDALYAGELRSNGAGRTTDELGQEVRSIIIRRLQSAAIAAGKKKSDVTPDQVRDEIARIGTNPKIVAAAQAVLDTKRAAMADLDVGELDI